MENLLFKKLQGMAAAYNTAKPPALVARADSEATLYIYDELTPAGFGGISAKDVAAELASAKGTKTLHVRINSPGGIIDEGKAIHTLLSEFPGKVIAHIDGIAASAASFLMMAADEIVAAPESMVMVHEAQGLALGHAANMRTIADLLDMETANIAAMYAKRTKQSVEDIRGWMGAMNGGMQGTFMTAQEAKERGFVDRILGEEAAPAKASKPATKRNSLADLEKETAIQLEVAKRNARLLKDNRQGASPKA